VCVCVYTHIYVHTYIYTYIHIYIYIYIYISAGEGGEAVGASGYRRRGWECGSITRRPNRSLLLSQRKKRH
jgi:hypothetical protein